MKRISYKGMLIIFLLLYGSTLWANSALQYSFSKEKIEKARFFDLENGIYLVTIELKEPYKEEFTKLTAKNIGKVLQVIFQGQIIVEAIIQDEISSGIIQSKWKSAEDAQRFMDTLLNRNLSDKPPP